MFQKRKYFTGIPEIALLTKFLGFEIHVNWLSDRMTSYLYTVGFYGTLNFTPVMTQKLKWNVFNQILTNIPQEMGDQIILSLVSHFKIY